MRIDHSRRHSSIVPFEVILSRLFQSIDWRFSDPKPSFVVVFDRKSFPWFQERRVILPRAHFFGSIWSISKNFVQAPLMERFVVGLLNQHTFFDNFQRLNLIFYLFPLILSNSRNFVLEVKETFFFAFESSGSTGTRPKQSLFVIPRTRLLFCCSNLTIEQFPRLQIYFQNTRVAFSPSFSLDLVSSWPRVPVPFAVESRKSGFACQEAETLFRVHIFIQRIRFEVVSWTRSDCKLGMGGY